MTLAVKIEIVRVTEKRIAFQLVNVKCFSKQRFQNFKSKWCNNLRLWAHYAKAAVLSQLLAEREAKINDLQQEVLLLRERIVQKEVSLDNIEKLIQDEKKSIDKVYPIPLNSLCWLWWRSSLILFLNCNRKCQIMEHACRRWKKRLMKLLLLWTLCERNFWNRQAKWVLCWPSFPSLSVAWIRTQRPSRPFITAREQHHQRGHRCNGNISSWSLVKIRHGCWSVLFESTVAQWVVGMALVVLLAYIVKWMLN